MRAAWFPLLILLLSSAAWPETPFYATDFPNHPGAQALQTLGRALFFDRALSASGRLSCASCHDPGHAFASPDAGAVQRGGVNGRRAGVRAVPSLMYAQNAPPFTEHYLDDEGDDGIDQGPAGGRTWDGRAQSAHAQAELPLLSDFEMGNVDAAAVLGRLQGGSTAGPFRETFGKDIFADGALAWRGVLLALETFQQDSRLFYPYTSKFDAYLRGQTTLTESEARGLAVFDDPGIGNCARCHPSARRGGALPQFTDFGYAALGVPRNPEIPKNRDPRYVDLGLCGPYRTDLQARVEYCGLFRTPTLRNVARRTAFFHNGVLATLREAVRFYAVRDSDPRYHERPDLPRQYRDNLDRQAPFAVAGERRRTLSEAQVDDLVAFLATLTDGWDAPTATVPTRRPVR